MKNFAFLASLLMASSLSAAPTTTTTTTQVPTTARTVTTPTTATTTTTTADVPAKDRFTTGDDQKIGNDIRVQIAEIIGAPNSNEIILIVDAGHVKLVGKVPTDDAKTKIGQAVQHIKGVKSVNNRLETAKKGY